MVAALSAHEVVAVDESERVPIQYGYAFMHSAETWPSASAKASISDCFGNTCQYCPAWL
jgi:hypothetical protein